MEKLTKEQRKAIYITAKELYEFLNKDNLKTYGGMCYAITKAMSIVKVSDFYKRDELLPELSSLKPKGKLFGEFWWTDEGRESIDIRLEKFDEIIKMCE